MYMPLCRECFNEKTRQQNQLQKLQEPAISTNSQDKKVFDSSSTLAESNQKSASEFNEHGSNTSAETLEDRGDPSS